MNTLLTECGRLFVLGGSADCSPMILFPCGVSHGWQGDTKIEDFHKTGQDINFPTLCPYHLRGDDDPSSRATDLPTGRLVGRPFLQDFRAETDPFERSCPRTESSHRRAAATHVRPRGPVATGAGRDALRANRRQPGPSGHTAIERSSATDHCGGQRIKIRQGETPSSGHPTVDRQHVTGDVRGRSAS